jgi:hypothetical protein
MVWIVIIAGVLLFGTSSSALSLKDFAAPAMRSDWRYDGFAEYGCNMRRLSEQKKGDTVQYRVRVAVDDMSDGESQFDKDYFNIENTFILAKATLVQNGMRRPMLDADFQSLELLRLPLQEGALWHQLQKNEAGKPVTIECVITNIATMDDRTIIDVTYASLDGERYEWRRFASGEGIIRYEARWGENMVGYQLYLPAGKSALVSPQWD